MKPPFNIRQATIKDADSIHQLARQSWTYTYNKEQKILDQQEIDQFISKAYDVEGLKKSLAQLPNTLSSFLVMKDERAEKIIGFGHIGYEKFWEINEDGTAAQLQTRKADRQIILFRLYLHPDYIGKGLGKHLLLKLEEFVLAEQVQVYGCKVLEKNEIGRRFYRKMGFEHKTELDEDDELFMVKQLD